MENTTPQEKVINALATAWSLYSHIPKRDKHEDDNPDFRKCIHDAQRIMFTQLRIKDMKEKEIKDLEDLKKQPSVFDNIYKREEDPNTLIPKKTFQERIDEKEKAWREKNDLENQSNRV